MKIVCAGDCGIDHYVPSGQMFCGGITANFARHAIQEFHEDDVVQLVSCVGNDVEGELVSAEFVNSRIDCFVTRIAGSTPVQTIEIEADGEKKFVRYDEGVLQDFRFSPLQREVIQASDLLVAPVYLQIIDLYDELLSIASSGLIAIDFADFLTHPDFSLLEKHLDKIDIGFFGLTLDDSKTMGRLGELAQNHNKIFVVTLGPDGSRVYTGNTIIECAAISVPQVFDTTGAGDAYAAGFLAQYCHGESIAISMQRGAKLASLVIATVGAVSR